MQQNFLLQIDIIYAKAKYAQEINAIYLQLILRGRNINYLKAYHPLLLQANRIEGKETYPQDLCLDSKNRIIIISGPNAGGKSITLKTMGLLQLMLQSSMLIPVHEKSYSCLFDQILTDIGDNQSIENHLSTYSYRLKNMKSF